MEEDIFLKKMKGVKPLKKDNNTLSRHKEINKIKPKKTKNTKTTKLPLEIKEYNNTEHKITFGEINKDLKKGRVKIDRRIRHKGKSESSKKQSCTAI